MTAETTHLPLHLVHAPGSPIERVLATLRRIGSSGANAILYGASGTGKETLARLAHGCGDGARDPFVPVQCAGRGEAELAAELISGPEPVLAPDRGGTVYLEDVGELPVALQGRLVRALDAAPGRRVRIIAASTRELFPDVAAGRFRRDLFDLLACPVHVPSLRDRHDDVLAVFDRCLRDAAPGLRLSPSARALLCDYPWPGNVREVEALVRRLGASCAPGLVAVRDVEEALLSDTYCGAWVASRRAAPHAPAPRTGGPPVSVELPSANGETIDLVAVLRRIESELIAWALERAGGSKTGAARLLGLRRTTLAEKLRRFEGEVQARPRLHAIGSDDRWSGACVAKENAS